MIDTEKLLAVEAVRNLKAAYFRCMDTRDWAGFSLLFTSDAVFDVRGALNGPKPEEAYAAEPVITGATNILAFVRTGLTRTISVHHGHNGEIEVLSEVSAKAIWPMTDYLIFPDGAPLKTFRGYGHYYETYSRQADGWRIATLKLRRLHVERG